MSTNFYVSLPNKYQDIRPTALHIGKRSGGCLFTFQSYQPEVLRELKSWDDWKAFLSAKPSAVIHDEYNRTYTLPELEKEVFKTLELWGPDQIPPKGKLNLDRHGLSHHNYEFS